jgi:hypothetical protein
MVENLRMEGDDLRGFRQIGGERPFGARYEFGREIIELAVDLRRFLDEAQGRFRCGRM